MAFWRRKVKKPAAWEARFSDPESDHYIAIQGRFASEREAHDRLTGRYAEQFPGQEWPLTELKIVKPPIKIPKV